jgi:hypothetical protein
LTPSVTMASRTVTNALIHAGGSPTVRVASTAWHRSEDGRREIRSGVLRFPDQHLGLGDLKRFSGQFGKIRSDAETSVADRSIVCC